MKRTNLFFAALGMLFLTASCVKEDCTKKMTYTKYEPIYKTYDEIRVDPEVGPSRTLKNTGKIYLYGSILLINEKNEGVHVIDNSNPSAPNNMAFISIPGNVDIAMQGTILYADNYTDLLAIDIADISNIRLKRRVNNAFPNYGVDAEKGVLVRYEGKEVTEEVNCNDPNILMRNDFAFETTQGTSGGISAAGNAGGGRESAGIGGSMARFAVAGHNLYVVDHSNMHIFDITTNDNPTKANEVQVGWGDIETIIPYNDKLFIGSSMGMYIYDNSNPSNPTYLSQFQHAEACDPVFVSGNFAYVTLRTGNFCQGINNQLDVVDISDIMNPTLVSTTPMTNPHGLTVEDDKLYLCDGHDGLKVFDLANKNAIGQNQLFHDNSLSTYDAIAIPNANTLLVIGEEGFHQYNTTTPSDLKLLSTIPVQQ